MMPVLSRQEVVITDLVKHASGAKMSAVTNTDSWRILDYELEEIGAGRGLAVHDWHPGKLTIHLGVSGFYRISFITRYSVVRAKLTGDRCFSSCNPVFEKVEFEAYYDAEDVLWREADLTGKDLIVDDNLNTTLLAIRLTPVEPAKDTREIRWPMACTNDGGVMMMRKHQTPADLLEFNECMPEDSCVRLLIYGGFLGDTTFHFTKVGTEVGDLHGEPWRPADRFAVENHRQYKEWGIDPSKAIVEYARERGWEIYFFVRHRGWHEVWPADGAWGSRFFSEHPEYINIGRNGEPIHGLSVAYPQVREHLCKLYAELADYGADGVCVCYIRGCPVVMYEPAMVEGFQAQYGQDPRELEDSDDRWLDYKAETVTTFMRELNDAIGTSCKLSAIVHGTRVLNRRFGLDVAKWIAEGTVHDLFIMGLTYTKWGCHSSSGGPEDLEYEYFEGLPGRQNVRLWPMLYLKYDFDRNPEKHCAALQKYMDAGADGYCFWDGIQAGGTDRMGNIWDLGKLPRPSYQKKVRLLGKYEMTRWCGYLFNRHTPLEGW